MNNDLLITLEILLVIDAPLLFLYMKSQWPLRTIILCLLSIPVLWYLTYSPIHEISHIVATYLVGGKVTYYKLIPSFWLGEFGHAWINSKGLTEGWQQIVSTSFPYIVDLSCIIAGFFVMQRSFAKNPFVIGFVFMLLCLRPAFDIICETIAFSMGGKGDLYCIKSSIGGLLMWSCIVLSLAISIFSILKILIRYAGVSGTSVAAPKN
jgi:hypothetical protein